MERTTGTQKIPCDQHADHLPATEGHNCTSDMKLTNWRHFQWHPSVKYTAYLYRRTLDNMLKCFTNACSLAARSFYHVSVSSSKSPTNLMHEVKNSGEGQRTVFMFNLKTSARCVRLDLSSVKKKCQGRQCWLPRPMAYCITNLSRIPPPLLCCLQG
jgi:hypothetical protein